MPLHHGRQSTTCTERTANGLTVTAESVIARIGNDPGPHRVQIDIGSYGRQCALAALKKDALESLFPERSLAAGERRVKP